MIPSPVVWWFKKIRCPDASPPSTAPFSRIISRTYRSPTLLTPGSIPISRRATKKPKLLITVAITRLFSSRPCSLYHFAQIAIIWSPVISRPVSSTAMSRSPSPSNARPMSASRSRTLALSPSVYREPHRSLMLSPSGAQCMTVTSAPSSEKIVGAALYVAPLAQSSTIRIPSSDRVSGKLLLQKTMYRPIASSMRWAFPISSAVGRMFLMRPPVISFSISSSTASGSLKPSREKSLIPLSWYGLWEADITTPASARIDRVMKAMPGVLIGPTSSTSTPIEQIPAVRADSSMYPLSRVSLPITIE